MKCILTCVLFSLIFVSVAVAHDPKMHKGPKVEGEVVGIQSNQVDLKTADGQVSVKLAPETTYESEDGEKKVAQSAMRKGQHVTISGHKMPDGSLVAGMVMIGGTHDESQPHSHGNDE